MMERFLERISLSEYKDKFILKGGMLVAAKVGLDARATMDLDATIKGTNVSVEDVEMIISQIISIPLNDGVLFRIKRIRDRLMPGQPSGCLYIVSTFKKCEYYHAAEPPVRCGESYQERHCQSLRLLCQAFMARIYV